MRPASILLAMIIVGFSGFHGAVNAEEYKWTVITSLEKGSPGNCGSANNHRRDITIKDGVFRAVGDGGGVFTSKLNKLKADGSGRIVMKLTGSGREVFFDFEAGNGPRKIRHVVDGGLCVWLWEPR
jgi:hypothetical protein